MNSSLRKRRQEIKNQSEAKRRIKLNEQLATLREMLLSGIALTVQQFQPF